MPFVTVTPDETDVFFCSAPQYSRINQRAVGTVSLKEMLRNEGSRFFYTVSCPRVACREEGSDWLNLELLRCDWLNLELLRCDWLNLELLRYDWSSDTLL